MAAARSISESTRPSSERRRAVLAQLPRLQRRDGSPIRVLVVDDEEVLADLIRVALGYEGWEVDVAHDGRQALRRFRDERPDVVVLDIMLPDTDGLRVLEELRRVAPGTPVLFLTARDSLDDRIIGLTAGGDDYMTKPFSLEELVARLRGLLRRVPSAELDADPILVVGDLTLDEEGYRVRRGGDELRLTATEFELLRYLMRNAERVVTRAQILDRVWNYDFGGRPGVVEMYISYLRRKIDAGRDPMIHTVRGVGYVLRAAS